MIALAVLGAVACVALGINAAGRLNRREAALRAWENALLRMDAAVNHSAAPLEEVLRRGAADDNLPVLTALMQRLNTMPASSAAELLDGLPWEDTLLPPELGTLKDCLSSLFSPSLQTQSQALAYVQSECRMYRQSCCEAREKNARLYISLGWLGGAAVFILLC